MLNLETLVGRLEVLSTSFDWAVRSLGSADSEPPTNVAVPWGNAKCVFRGCERFDVHGGWEALIRLLCSIVRRKCLNDSLVGEGRDYDMARSSLLPYLHYDRRSRRVRG